MIHTRLFFPWVGSDRPQAYRPSTQIKSALGNFGTNNMNLIFIIKNDIIYIEENKRSKQC